MRARFTHITWFILLLIISDTRANGGFISHGDGEQTVSVFSSEYVLNGSICGSYKLLNEKRCCGTFGQKIYLVALVNVSKKSNVQKYSPMQPFGYMNLSREAAIQSRISACRSPTLVSDIPVRNQVFRC